MTALLFLLFEHKSMKLKTFLAGYFSARFYSKGHKIGLDSSEYVCTTGAVNHSTGEDGYA